MGETPTFKDLIEARIQDNTGEARRFEDRLDYQRALAEACAQLGEDTAKVSTYQKLTPRQATLVMRLLGVENTDFVDMMAVARREMPVATKGNPTDTLSGADSLRIDGIVDNIMLHPPTLGTDEMLSALAGDNRAMRGRLFIALEEKMRPIADSAVKRAVHGGYTSISDREEDFMHDAFMQCVQRVEAGRLQPQENDFMRYYNTTLRNEVQDTMMKIGLRNRRYDHTKHHVNEPQSLQGLEAELTVEPRRPSQESRLGALGEEEQGMLDIAVSLEPTLENIVGFVSANAKGKDGPLVAHALRERVLLGKTMDRIAAELKDHPGLSAAEMSGAELVDRIRPHEDVIRRAVGTYAPEGKGSYDLYMRLFTNIDGPEPAISVRDILHSKRDLLGWRPELSSKL